MTRLPIDWPPLVAEAERLARELLFVMDYAFSDEEARDMVESYATLLADLTREASRAHWLAYLARLEGKDPTRGVVFDRPHKWDGGAYYVLATVPPDDHGALYDPTVYYASESVERLIHAEADVILPALAHGPDEAEALGIILRERVAVLHVKE